MRSPLLFLGIVVLLSACTINVHNYASEPVQSSSNGSLLEQVREQESNEKEEYERIVKEITAACEENCTATLVEFDGETVHSVEALLAHMSEKGVEIPVELRGFSDEELLEYLGLVATPKGLFSCSCPAAFH